ncbi:pyruvate-formate lyase-activating enzyme [Desulfomicrobium macestii]|uniref:Pyruvate-formate lyase-activating enzyme n=1 Tax=Desulfomicrobium macestii TaxID=90731 RepID=A0ABR9H7H6_9BACT|nr:pyruvate-formate lyase-activating enzyme [Desulfomicrobium macestii]
MTGGNSTVAVSSVVECLPQGNCRDIEHAAHGAQKVFDTGDEPFFQFPFAVLFIEFQKIEGVAVSYGQLGLVAERRRQRLFEIVLAGKGFLVVLIMTRCWLPPISRTSGASFMCAS